MAGQSSIFPIFLRAEYSDSTALQRFQSDAQRAAMAAKREFEGVGAALEGALSRARNSAGSLDLGIDGLRQAAAQQQQVAAAARELAEATKRAALANGQFDRSMAGATKAAFQLAKAEEAASRELQQQVAALDAVQRELNQTASATDLVTQSARRGTTARGNVINSVRAERTAFIQLGQQLQDITVQAQMGTNAFIIMGQQLPQAAFALTGLENSANKTKAAIGRIATFLSGPWGAAFFVGLAVLGPFVQKLIQAGNESEKARVSSLNFANGLNILSMSAENATTAMDGLIGKLQSAIKFQGDFLRGQIAIARQSAADLQAQIRADEQALAAFERAKREELGSSFLPTGLLPNSPNNPVKAFEMSQVRERLAQNRAKLPTVLEAAGAAAIAEANRNIAESLDPIQKKINEVDDAIARLNQRRLNTVTGNDALADGNIGQQDFETQLGELARRRTALEKLQRENNKTPRKDRSAEIAARKAAREAERLATFGEKAAEQIQRINERFDEQPRLIDAAAQATRQLDSIIAELSERKPVNFRQMIDDAEEAKRVVEDAIKRPVEDILRRSEERLAVERLIAQGRIDEAVALQEIQRLQEQIGELTEQQVDDIRNQIFFEQRKTRELRAQAELLELQADVARTVGDDMRRIFSGRGTFGDLVKNFRQALLDLQGARLFEDLFGPAFRQLEEELRGNTPQGRANARYTAEVNKTADITTALSDALSYLTDSVTAAGDRLRGIPANDNGVRIGPDGSMVVTGNRTGKDAETKIARRSVIDIAKEIGETVEMRFASVLDGVLGPRAIQLLGQTIGGFIAGKALGGTTGGILGALEGLTKNVKGLEGVSKLLGKGLEGAATGTQVNAIGKALGIRGSSTGAQIGGALGAATGIPGGQIIGAILGNVVGGLLKSPKRGSATIGGVGGGLGITGTVGNSAALRGTANTLAGSVLESIQNIARQLGATVDSSRGAVSIGQRKDSLRVDPSGRGATKIGNGAIDFGQDSEAAIAFAVQNLIQDGVITGLRASENRLLRAGKDINAALQDVLSFRSIFDRLKAIKDPIGFAIDEINREFTAYIDLFKRAGASAEEFAQLEELYGLERARAIEDATDRVIGSLRSLLQDLKIGDSGLSLRDRQANALGSFNSLAARVASGDASAFDEFSDVSRQLLDIERQLFGSTQSYFDRLAQITALTEQAIAGQTNVTSIGSNRPNLFDQAPQIDRSIDIMNGNLGSKLDAINYNLIALNPASRTGGGFQSGPEYGFVNAQSVRNF